ncbi:MAG: LysM peptidoglycan-binding domain-containing protein [Treponema sp.]|jgi:nucleoid-associated protein YgaU|nr:LysM peptidoglycan-binding domain-containing protein [Treponema sp.]
MISAIGIKIANGEFYPILEKNAPVKKRLVLTTVHDNQQSVHIDLYKSNTATMRNALYIGSLLIDHLKPAPKGEPSIEIIVTSNGYGKIAVDAVGLDSAAETRHLQVAMNVPVDSSLAMGADFEVEDVMPSLNPPTGLYVSEAKEKFPWLIALVSLIGVLIILFLLWFFLLRGKGNREMLPDVLSAVESPQPEPTPLPTASSAPLAASVPPSPALAPELATPEPLGASVAEPEPVAESEPLATGIAEPEPFMPIEEVTEEPKQATAVVPLIEAPVQAPEPMLEEVPRSRPAPPVASYKVPTTIPPSGAPYRIRWGDTLWDISEAFYRNPWLYLRIARFNNIRNPDLIVSGTTIRIPPR